MIVAGPYLTVHFRMMTRNLATGVLTSNAKVRYACSGVPFPVARTQCVLYSTEQQCVVAKSTLPDKVLYYETSQSTDSINGLTPCLVVGNQNTQQYGETCALKCEDGYHGSPLLHCAAGDNKTTVSGNPEYQQKQCLRRCDCLCCSNSSSVVCCNMLTLRTTICLKCFLYSTIMRNRHRQLPGRT